MGAQAALDHGDHCFDLTSSPIESCIKAGLHQSSIVSGGRLESRSTTLGENYAPDAKSVARECMIGFGVKTCIGQNDLNRHPAAGLLKQVGELLDVQTGTFAGSHGQQEMGEGIRNQTERRG